MLRLGGTGVLVERLLFDHVLNLLSEGSRLLLVVVNHVRGPGVLVPNFKFQQQVRVLLLLRGQAPAEAQDLVCLVLLLERRRGEPAHVSDRLHLSLVWK